MKETENENINWQNHWTWEQIKASDMVIWLWENDYKVFYNYAFGRRFYWKRLVLHYTNYSFFSMLISTTYVSNRQKRLLTSELFGMWHVFLYANVCHISANDGSVTLTGIRQDPHFTICPMLEQNCPSKTFCLKTTVHLVIKTSIHKDVRLLLLRVLCILTQTTSVGSYSRNH